jgi:hypothetical protein
MRISGQRAFYLVDLFQEKHEGVKLLSEKHNIPGLLVKVK